MKILIDNGHGSNTAGKCSPDNVCVNTLGLVTVQSVLLQH